jgi:hypothetical protein
MNVSEIITEINQHGFAELPDSLKLNVINDTLWEIEAEEPWPFLEKTIDLTFDGTNDYPTNLPTDFKSVRNLVTRDSSPVTLNPITKQEYRDFYFQYPEAKGTPHSYYVSDKTIHFVPIPPSTTVVRLDYIATQPEVDATTPESGIYLPPRHHRLIVLGALAKLYMADDAVGYAQVAIQMYRAKLELVKADILMDQWQRPKHITVVDEDDEIDIPIWL